MVGIMFGLRNSRAPGPAWAPGFPAAETREFVSVGASQNDDAGRCGAGRQCRRRGREFGDIASVDGESADNLTAAAGDVQELAVRSQAGVDGAAALA
jgi:hypothetical protein